VVKAMSKMSDEDRRGAFRQTLRAMPGYPWLPCPICVADGFKGAGGCDHIAAERARAAGITFGIDTIQ